MINLANEFYKINNIEINGKKSELFAINPTHKQDFVIMGTNKDKVYVKNKNDPTRILGNWFKATLGQQHIFSKIKQIFSSFILSMNRKKLSAAHVTYLHNQVILPKIDYLLKTVPISKDKCDALQGPCLKMIKKKNLLPSTASNFILFHQEIYNIHRLWHQYTESHITNFVKHLNSTLMD